MFRNNVVVGEAAAVFQMIMDVVDTAAAMVGAMVATMAGGELSKVYMHHLIVVVVKVLARMKLAATEVAVKLMVETVVEESEDAGVE